MGQSTTFTKKHEKILHGMFASMSGGNVRSGALVKSVVGGGNGQGRHSRFLKLPELEARGLGGN